ncbi:MAG TPA: hypothetical protein IAB25_04310 [Candidatus Coproplasma stercoravium]|nr:hypothetical protein [Candidatus Coproplasma stercoravium]
MELVIVIAVIAVLAAVLIPTLPISPKGQTRVTTFRRSET